MRIRADLLIKSLYSDLSPHIDLAALDWAVDSSPLQAACYRQRDSLLKKFNQEDKPSESAERAALDKFLAVNNRLLTWEYRWDFSWEAELLTEFRNELHEFWLPRNNSQGSIFQSYSQLFNYGRTGPGASIGAKTYDFYTKMFCSPLSSTRAVSDTWTFLIDHCPQFSQALCEAGGAGVRIVDHNRLSFVNKNQQVARSICTEPTVNMWLQLGLGTVLERRIKSRYNIDFTSQQDVNRAMARRGSIQNDLVTIDLESASDSLGQLMLKEFLPSSFWGLLQKLRCPTSLLPNGDRVSLNMVSTMGNGFTFSLQTAIFSACCAAVYKYLGIPMITHESPSTRNMSVYGDDIIVDKRVSPYLLRLLQLLGFKVNDSKTFVEGPFRESCGVDCFLGVDIRPVYLKRLLSLQDAFVAINRLNLWSASTGVPLRNTVSYVLACFPRARKCLVPLDEDDAAGLKVPTSLLDDADRRVSGALGLLRYTASVPLFYGYKFSIDDACETGKLVKHPRNVAYHPYGSFVALLGGYVRGYRVSLRQKETRYTTKRRVTPRWNYLPPQILSGYPDRQERFALAVRSNL